MVIFLRTKAKVGNHTVNDLMESLNARSRLQTVLFLVAESVISFKYITSKHVCILMQYLASFKFLGSLSE